MNAEQLINIITTESDTKKVIEALKQKNIETGSWENLKSLFLPQLHPIIVDPKLRPKDKTKGDHTDKVSKITYAAPEDNGKEI